jgi:hypothetical protein
MLFSGIVIKMYDTKTTKQLRFKKCQLHIKQHITTNESKAVLFSICTQTKLHDEQNGLSFKLEIHGVWQTP